MLRLSCRCRCRCRQQLVCDHTKRLGAMNCKDGSDLRLMGNMQIQPMALCQRCNYPSTMLVPLAHLHRASQPCLSEQRSNVKGLQIHCKRLRDSSIMTRLASWCLVVSKLVRWVFAVSGEAQLQFATSTLRSKSSSCGSESTRELVKRR